MNISNRTATLLVILCIVTVTANIILTRPDKMIWPSELKYQYPSMFHGTALMYSQPGTEGWKLIDMNEAVVVVTEFGAPLNCAVINIVMPDGVIRGDCVQGILDGESEEVVAVE